MDSGFDMEGNVEWEEEEQQAGPNMGPPCGPRRGGDFGYGRGFEELPSDFDQFPEDDYGPGSIGFDSMGPGPMGHGPMGFGPMGPGPMGPGPMGPGPMGPGPIGPGPTGRGRRGPGRMGPPGPQMWGRGFGPGGPPSHQKQADNKAIRYLIRCGIAKENLKNVPRDLLRLIEPDHCGLCGQSFDSFAMSRMHYISKNHFKNHKKWLAQQTEGRYQRSKEIPLKSRDLYCELCDVQITSKAHADSHYAGKSHRSVVEGRKNPKNPMLLQPGMQERVKQLIRREKKHIKNSEEVEEEAAVAAPKEPKSVPPELYCDICKTSVTCTEQMTMHLNGKRHLNKEKQHILQMMKKGNAAEEEEFEPADADMNLQDGAENDAAQAEDDWENGGGAWDEPELRAGTD